jgi:hypothetical protein
MKCSSSFSEALGSSIIASRRETRSVGACRIWERRYVRALVAYMVAGMVLVLVVDLSQKGDVRFLYLHL